MSRGIELLREITYPLGRSAVMLAMLTFFLCIELAKFAGVFGTILLLLVLPALMRYQLQLLESRARGGEAEPPGIEIFSFFENAWSLFALVLLIFFVIAEHVVATRVGIPQAVGLGILGGMLLPAMLAVLAITHAPLQSLALRPVLGLVRRCGPDYWILTAYAIAAGLFVVSMRSLVPAWVSEFVGLYLSFALFALTGGILRRHGLADDIVIPAALEAGTAELARARNRERQRVLNHAYGMISRDNRRGGLAHIMLWLEKDPDPDTAWAWFFVEMLRWEKKEAALVFAQRYLSRLLQNHEFVPAVKLMMRCYEIDAGFRPLPDDRPLALAAAKHCHNEELAAIFE